MIKKRAKKILGAFFALSLCAPFPAISSNVQSESELPSTAETHSIESVLEPMENIESKTLWLIERYKFQGNSLLLSLAAIQAQDALGLSVVVLDPPPEDMLSQALKASSTKTQDKKPQKLSLPLKDIPSTAPTKSGVTLPRVTLHLKATAVKLTDLAPAQKEVIQQITDCGPNRRRAVAFIRAEAIEKRFNVPSDRAREWSQYGRAACIDWNTLPDPALKNSDQTVFRPL